MILLLLMSQRTVANTATAIAIIMLLSLLWDLLWCPPPLVPLHKTSTAIITTSVINAIISNKIAADPTDTVVVLLKPMIQLLLPVLLLLSLHLLRVTNRGRIQKERQERNVREKQENEKKCNTREKCSGRSDRQPRGMGRRAPLFEAWGVRIS